MKVETVLFEQPGPQNTEEALKIALAGLKQFNATKVIVASTSGSTARKALEIMPKDKLIVVSHAFGFYEPNEDEMDEEVRKLLASQGVPVLTTSHTFAGFARAVRRKFKTYLVEDIVAAVLRTACEGFKVGYELACMCVDAGLVQSGSTVITVAGTGEGADTVLVLEAANSHDFFANHLVAILAKPR